MTRLLREQSRPGYANVNGAELRAASVAERAAEVARMLDLGDRSSWLSQPVRCLDTGERFPSQRQAAMRFGLNEAALCKALKRGSRCGGKRFVVA